MRPRVLRHDVSGEGEPLVLVPGGLTGWLSWLPHTERLSATRRTVRVQPLHNELGSAGQPGDPRYTAETERESLRLTLDELGLDRPDLAGWSGGGRALLEFALA
jgi:pimeloyl-ACP methyl ester carboxylesterase